MTPRNIVATLARRFVHDVYDVTLLLQDVRGLDSRFGRFTSGEGGWEDAFPGVERTSRWLSRTALPELLADAGYDSVDVGDDHVERNPGRRRARALATRQ